MGKTYMLVLNRPGLAELPHKYKVIGKKNGKKKFGAIDRAGEKLDHEKEATAQVIWDDKRGEWQWYIALVGCKLKKRYEAPARPFRHRVWQVWLPAGDSECCADVCVAHRRHRALPYLPTDCPPRIGMQIHEPEPV